MRNQCMCCGNDLGTDSYCSVCGKSALSVIGGEEIDAVRLETMAKNYIQNLLKDIRIQVKCYTYPIDDETVGEPSALYRDLCMASQYWVGDVAYMDMRFEKLPSNQKTTVQLRVIGNGTDREFSVSIQPKKTIARNRLGIQFLKGMRAKLVIGDSNGVAYSEEFEIYKRTI